MRFCYEYHTKDNVPHKGVVDASDREDAFARLKSEGIRPWKVYEAPGFFNKLFGKGKRWIAISALFVLATALGVYALRAKNEVRDVMSGFDSRVRRQVIGDAMVVEKGIRDGWADTFKDDGERYLAAFAIPGALGSVPVASDEAIEKSLVRSVVATADDSLESRQIKAMVEGMKDELRAYLAKNGSVGEFRRELMRRQAEEAGYYERAKDELEKSKESLTRDELEDLWLKRNTSLHQMGIKTVPMPGE